MIKKITLLSTLLSLGAVALIFLLPGLARASTATLRFTLPPSAIAVPQELRFGREVYLFVENCQEGRPCFRHNNAITNKVTADRLVDTGTGLTFYQLTVRDIGRGAGQLGLINRSIARFLDSFKTASLAYSPPPASNYFFIDRFRDGRISPWGWRLTFRSKPANDLLALVANPEQRISGSFATARDRECSEIVSSAGRFACLTYRVRFQTPEGHDLNQTLTQSIGLPEFGGAAGVVFEGNVAGGLGLANFSLDSPNSIVLGGRIVNVLHGVQIQDYLRAGSGLRADEPLADMFNRFRGLFESYFQRAVALGQTPTTIWNLNSPDTNPNNLNSTTFSSPPEGRVWRHSGDLTITDRIQFSGSGTILVDGNVTVNGVACAPNTRLGLVATGNLTFSDNNIDCGGYLSLGSISFNSPQRTTVVSRGIFVARDDIIIPEVTLGANMRIRYDTTFGQNPTNFFIEALKLIFKTAS